jgi:glycosyltransferase involved in cell wall biosynthesis
MQMSYQPLISVIIPTYNYGLYILDALKSVSEQSFSDWECIIVDDGSIDNTKELVAEYIVAHPDQHFRYVYIQNSGTSVAKNTGINLARGKYIQFLDADDLLSKDKLAVQAAIIESSDCALVFSGSVFFEDRADQQLVYHQYPNGFLATATLQDLDLLEALIKNNVVTISSPLVHKGLIEQAGKFQVTLRNNEDWLLWFRVALLKPIFIFDGDARSFSKIRIHSNSAMKGQHNMFLGEVIVRNEMESLLRNSNGILGNDALIRKNMDLLALHRIRSLDINKGFSHILLSFFKRPVQTAPLLLQGFHRLFARIVRNISPGHGS